MPKLWDDTIDAHRREVRRAIQDTTATLVAEHGLVAVTMSQIAGETGIGRATLYKYFAGVEEILRAWHEGQIAGHLAHLAAARDQAGEVRDRLPAVLRAYVRVHRQRSRHHGAATHGGELGALLHRGDRLVPAEQQLHELVREVVAEAAAIGEVRSDVAPGELAAFCIHALDAAAHAPSGAAAQRLVGVVLDGLRPPG